MENKKLKLGKNILSLGITSFFTDMSTEMIYPLLPMFLSETLGLTKSFIGIIEGAGESIANVLKIFSGWLSDKIRKRKLLALLGYSISTAMKPLFALIQTGWQALILRAFERTGKGIRTAPRDAIIAASVTEDVKGRAFGFHRMMDTLGAVIGPLFATLLLIHFHGNYRKVFLLSAIPALIAVFVIAIFVEEKIKEKKEEIIEEKFKPYFKLFLTSACIFMLSDVSKVLLMIRLREVGVGAVYIPVIWMCFNLIYAGLSYPAGILADKYGTYKVLIFGFILHTFVYLAFIFVTHKFSAILLLLLLGVYKGISDGQLRRLTSTFTEKKLGTAYGLYHSLTGASLLIGNLIFGRLWQSFSVKMAFTYAFILSLSGTILFIILSYLITKSERGFTGLPR